MTWILIFIGFFTGLIVSSFALLQSLICIFFAIPTANKLTQQGVFVNPNPIARKYFLSASILFFIFVGISFTIYLFAPETIFTGYVAGAVMTLLFSLGQIGGNKNNWSEFVDTNAEYLDKENFH